KEWRRMCGVAGLGMRGRATGGADGALDDGLVEVVAAELAGRRVLVVTSGGKDPLPGPLVAGGGVLAGEGVGKLDMAGTGGEVAFVLRLYGGKVTREVRDQGLGHHGHPILLAFPIADGELPAGQIEVLRSDGQRF